MMKKKHLSRQRLNQIKMVKQGRCQLCANKLDLYKVYCNSCAIKHRELCRKRGGFKVKVEGGRGRPPFIQEKP